LAVWVALLGVVVVMSQESSWPDVTVLNPRVSCLKQLRRSDS
jgi:hypothetical protein